MSDKKIIKYFTASQAKVTELEEVYKLSKDASSILDLLYDTDKLIRGLERRKELLLELCTRYGIKDNSKDEELEVYSHTSTSFEYNNEVLEQELKELKEKVSDKTKELKADTNTKKVYNSKMAVKIKKEQ